MAGAGHHGRHDTARRGSGRGLRAATAGAAHSADAILIAALAVDTALAVIDAVTPIVLLNLLIFGPLVAAFRASARTTAIVSA